MADKKSKRLSARLTQKKSTAPAEGGLRATGASLPMLHFEHVEERSSGAPVLDFGTVFPLERSLKHVEVFNACSTPINVWLESKPAWVEVEFLPNREEEVQLVVGESMVVSLVFRSDRGMDEHAFDGELIFSSEAQAQEKVSTMLKLLACTSLREAWGEYRFGGNGMHQEHDFGEIGGGEIEPYRLAIRNSGRLQLEARLESAPEWLQVADSEGNTLASAELWIEAGEEQVFLLSPTPVEGVAGSTRATVQLVTNDVRDDFRRVSLEFRAMLPTFSPIAFSPPAPVLVGAGQKARCVLSLQNKGKRAVEVAAAKDSPASLTVQQDVLVPGADQNGNGHADMVIWVHGSAERTGRHEDILPLQIGRETDILIVPITYECVSTEIAPLTLDFGRLKPDESRKSPIRIITKGRSSLRIQATVIPSLADALVLVTKEDSVFVTIHAEKLTQKIFAGTGIQLAFPELGTSQDVGVTFEVLAPPPPKLWLVCPECGRCAPPEAERCADPICATPLAGAQSVPESELKRCPKCNIQFGYPNKYCLYDGVLLQPLKLES
jgi:hypothetical protein